MLTTRVSLLERLRDPADEAAWARFVELYTPLLLRWCDRQNLRSNDAADLMQDVMALLVRKFTSFQYDADGSFRAWLKTVFLNKHRERLRRKSARTVGDVETLAEIPAPSSDDDAEDRRLLVRRGLELIRPEFGDSVWSAFWEYAVTGRPPTEVAKELGLSPGTVYASKSRVLSRLRLEIGFLPD